MNLTYEQAQVVTQLATKTYTELGGHQVKFAWQGPNMSFCYLAAVLMGNDPNWFFKDVLQELYNLGLDVHDIMELNRLNDEEGLDWRQINTHILRMAQDGEDTNTNGSIEETDRLFL